MSKFLRMLVFGIAIISGCGYDFKEEGLYAIIDTSKGEMVFKLNYDTRPITVGNFAGLVEGRREYTDVKTGQKVKKPFYDGLIFHRVIKGFMIQGGCPFGNGTGGPGYSFADEFEPPLNHDSKGILSMANAGPGTNGSQFFITLAPTGHLDGKHTVWGKIVYGMDVLEKIGNVETGRADKPVKDVVIDSIKIKRIGKDAQAFDSEKAFAKNDEFFKIKEEELNKQLRSLFNKLGISEKNIITTGSGLKYYIKRNGTGSKPEPGDIITAHYTGYLADGTKFDSSYDRGQPFEVAIGTRRVIPGWDEAFADMKRGEKRVLIIPFNLAYGERGRSPVIPPRATLIFDVELIKYRKN